MMEQQTPATQKTILIVDDDANVLKLVRGLLGNYHLLTASDGEAGLQQSRDYEGAIHILLSDFQMPGMSGVDLATKISHDRPQFKVLLMSGFPEGMLVLNEGRHFLAKPFIPSQLRALVAGLLQT